MSAPGEHGSSDASLDGLIEAFVAELRRGEKPSVAEHAARCPEPLAERLKAMLEAVELLEQGRGLRAGAGESRGESVPAPERIGPFRLVREIGRGAMGVVYEALQEPLGRKVAIKLLRDYRLAEPDALARFQREAAVAARLDHPGICTVFESGVDAGMPYIAMRLLEGESLAQRLARARENPPERLAPAEAARLVESVARTVHAAHEAGVVHRDLKPANVLVTPDGAPVVLDFGLARELDDAAVLTRTGDACGTPAYLAPERIDRRSPEPGPQADVYALGVILYECLALRRPFEAATLEGLYRQALLEDPPDVRRFHPAVSRDLAAVTEAALEKQPARRYRSALHLAEDLCATREGRAVSVRYVSRLGRLARLARREPVQALLAAGAALAVVALAALFTYLAARWPELESARAQAAERVAEAELERGFLALGEGNAADGARAFEDLLAGDSRSAEALAGLVLADLSLGRAALALERLDANEDLRRGHPAFELLRADVLRALGRPPESPTSALSDDADPLDLAIDGMRELERGHAEEHGAFGRALERFTSAVELSRQARALYWFERAHAAGHAGDAEAVESCVRSIARLWPESATGAFWAAFALSKVGDGGALDAWSEAARLDPRSELVLGNHALALFKAERFPEAAEAYRAALELAPNSAEMRWNFGLILQQLGHHEQAARSYCEALRADAAFFRARSSAAADSLRDLPGREQVAAACRALAGGDPADARPLEVLALVQLSAGDEAAAVETLRASLARDPGSAGAELRLGVALFALGRREEALAPLERAVELAPDVALFRTKLVLALEELGRGEALLEACRDALERLPGDPDLASELGTVLIRNDYLDEAVLALERAAGLSPGTSRVHFELGDALRKLGRFAESIESYRASLALDPESAETWCNLGNALKRSGQFREALAAYQRGDELGRAQPGWRYPSERWVAECEALTELEPELDEYLSGGEVIGDTEHLASLASMAQLRGLHGTAVALYAQAFEDGALEPGPGIAARARYNAVCAASRASAGEAASAERRAELAAQAHRWLSEELADWLERAAAGAVYDDELAAELGRWRADPDLAPIRDPAALEQLGAVEREALASLWKAIEGHELAGMERR